MAKKSLWKKYWWIVALIVAVGIFILFHALAYPNRIFFSDVNALSLCSQNIVYSSAGTQNGQSVSTLKVNCDSSTYEYICVSTSSSGYISQYGSIFNGNFYGNYDYCSKKGMFT